MHDLFTRLHSLNRPRILARAARAGIAAYSRSRDLRRVLGALPPKGRGMILMRLLDLEAELNAQRLAQSAGYSAVRHVDVLIALAAEGEAITGERRLSDRQTAPQEAPSGFDKLEDLPAT